MLTSLLKRCWKASPQVVRLAALHVLCLLRAERRVQDVAGGEPLYVCGAFYSHSGLGQSARLYAAEQLRAGVEVVPVDITAAMALARDFTPDAPPLTAEDAASRQGQGIVILHANPPQFQLALCRLGRDFLRGKRVVGYWAWELEVVPDIWRHALRYVDEVQVPSAFVQQTLQQLTPKPVRCVPHAVVRPVRCKTSWAEDGVVRCLYIFDAGSSFARKNPLAALRAFQKAFAPGEAELTFKVAHIHADTRLFADFQRACVAVPGVRLVTTSLSSEDMDDLFLRHDIYLSLHCSEGYGLTIREAMLRGLHVVATGWSGNMDFMQGETCHAVPYRLVPVTFTYGPCKGLAARWAEADIDAAAEILRHVRRCLLHGGSHA
ncbi:MAG: glycosyltransferase [Desulfovibrio sp.]|nr:glycosyltransferase [Desulfovibrio sp.]